MALSVGFIGVGNMEPNTGNILKAARWRSST
jgi:hypothetical protein